MAIAHPTIAATRTGEPDPPQGDIDFISRDGWEGRPHHPMIPRKNWPRRCPKGRQAIGRYHHSGPFAARLTGSRCMILIVLFEAVLGLALLFAVAICYSGPAGDSFFVRNFWRLVSRR